MTDDELEILLGRFLDRTLPAADWTHQAHLRVGLMLARRLPQTELHAALRDNIRAYNVASGGTNTDEAGYHETITAFYAATLGAYARATMALTPSEAARRLLAGPLADRKIVLRAYDTATLASKAARLAHRPPDREGFSPEALAAEHLTATADADFTLRLAGPADMARLRPLMDEAIGALLPPFLPPELVEASREIMGLDSQLIADGTYFVVESGGEIVGCGGWSRRATLFGGDHSAGRDAALLDARTEPARVRAMYTRPGWERRGVGRRVLTACEAAAAAEGFNACELAATLGGEPLYRACGYAAVESFKAETREGLKIPLVRMRKALTAAP